MKAYTDISQSKKLAEILPLESADMSINHSLLHNMTTVLTTPYKKLHEFFSGDTPDTTLPCWSLAALLDQLEDMIYDEEGNQWQLVLKKVNVQYDIYYLNICAEQDNIELDRFYDDLIDCCYEMIVKLKERNLL